MKLSMHPCVIDMRVSVDEAKGDNPLAHIRIRTAAILPILELVYQPELFIIPRVNTFPCIFLGLGDVGR